MVRYQIPEYANAQEFLSHVARRRGKLLKGGIPDYMDAARIVLQDWNNGGISYYTLPPVDDKPKSGYEAISVVSTFAQEFNIDDLLEEADNDSVMVLPSIDTIPSNSLVEVMATDEDTDLDTLFTSMMIKDVETKQEETEYEDDGMVVEDDEDDSTPHIKNPISSSNEFNPQTNQHRKKNLKKQRKKEKKQQQAAFNQEQFDFASDFVADNELGDDDDEDLLDI